VASAALLFEKARARHDRIGGRAARRERGAERHIGRTLLVARMHHPDRVAGVEHGIEQMVALHPGRQ